MTATPTGLSRQAHLPHGTRCFLDSRSDDRALVVRWESGDDTGGGPGSVVVLSLWREDLCVGTFRLRRDDVPALVHTLSCLAPDAVGVA